MSDALDRRGFFGAMTAATVITGVRNGQTEKAGAAPSPSSRAGVPQVSPRVPAARPFLTEASDFVDVSRGNPKPFKLQGEALVKARLTPGSWRLEIISDGSSKLTRENRLEDGTALDLEGLRALGRAHGVSYLKAMQCNNIPSPLGQGLWEGVPLRDVLHRVGRTGDVRRVYYWGFHNNDPQQTFQSSLSYNRIMETPPWEPPPLVAYRLNGKDIPLERGGPVRMIVPWAHGFKSIKWLQRIIMTNDYKANDTYALQNNDPESYLKTAAYLGKEKLSARAGKPITIEGTAVSGWSGLARVEFWLRPATEAEASPTLADDDPAWNAAVWRPCDVMPPPDDWETILPAGTSSRQLWGFSPQAGKPKQWPLVFSAVPWSARIDGLSPGTYEFRARTVDLNGFAQPEPRPYQKSGMNLVPCQTLVVTA